MDRHVPSLPEATNGLSVPPVFIEFSVSKSKELSNEIHNGMEHKVES